MQILTACSISAFLSRPDCARSRKAGGKHILPSLLTSYHLDDVKVPPANIEVTSQSGFPTPPSPTLLHPPLPGSKYMVFSRCSGRATHRTLDLLVSFANRLPYRLAHSGRTTHYSRTFPSSWRAHCRYVHYPDESDCACVVGPLYGCDVCVRTTNYHLDEVDERIRGTFDWSSEAAEE